MFTRISRLASWYSLPPPGSRPGPGEENATDAFERRHLAIGEQLFRQDDLKQNIYRVRHGALCIYQASVHDGRVVIRYAYAGDWVGLGFLRFHAESARTIANTVVDCLCLAAQDKLAVRDDKVRLELDAAIEREFEYRRNALVQTVKTPMTRVASFLLALSSINRHEGRDALLIAEPVEAMASHLGLSIDEIDCALIELRNLNLIEPASLKGWFLKDLDGLDAMDQLRASEALGSTKERYSPVPPSNPHRGSVSAVRAPAYARVARTPG